MSRRGRFVVTSAMAGDRGKGRVVVWFRNDLRVRDNETLKQAADMCRGGAAEVLPLYCFDPRFFGTTPWGNPKTGPFRAQFQLESVLDLKKSLRALGSGKMRLSSDSLTPCAALCCRFTPAPSPLPSPASHAPHLMQTCSWRLGSPRRSSRRSPRPRTALRS